MIIQEAIKSGKPFKRKGRKRFYYVLDMGSVALKDEKYPASTYYNQPLSARDILATDWEIKQ